MSDDLQKFVKEREKHLKSSQESLDNNKGKDPSASKISAFGQNETKLQKWWRSKRETQSKSENEGCDLLYESMIKDMLEDHTKETRFNSSVVVINSFDQQRGDIQEKKNANKHLGDTGCLIRCDKGHALGIQQGKPDDLKDDDYIPMCAKCR
jgi:hypothetical protein